MPAVCNNIFFCIFISIVIPIRLTTRCVLTRPIGIHRTLLSGRL